MKIYLKKSPRVAQLHDQLYNRTVGDSFKLPEIKPGRTLHPRTGDHQNVFKRPNQSREKRDDTRHQNRYTSYDHMDGGRVQAYDTMNKHNARQRSLPAKRGAENPNDRPGRRVSSAPFAKQEVQKKQPFPKLNSLMAKLTSQEFAGMPTKDNDRVHEKCQKLSQYMAIPHPKYRQFDGVTIPRNRQATLPNNTHSTHAHISPNRERNERPSPGHDSEETKTDVGDISTGSDDQKYPNSVQTVQRAARKWIHASNKQTKTEMMTKAEKKDRHIPLVNDKMDIRKVYVGTTLTRDLVAREVKHKSRKEEGEPKDDGKDSPKRKNCSPPREQKEHLLTKQEADMYRHLQQTYNDASVSLARQKRFYKKLERIQLDMAKDHNRKIDEVEVKNAESLVRRNEQLGKVRRKYDDERWRRFRSQYVTASVLEREEVNRHDYGLPEDLSETGVGGKIKRRKKKRIKVFDTKKAMSKNKKQFKVLFSRHGGARWDPHAKTPKMEGIDTVVIEETDSDGNKKEVKRDVEDVMKEAEDALRIPESGDLSDNKTTKESWKPRSRQLSSNSSDSDDDDVDIFERARQKYELLAEDDDELGMNR